MPDVVMNYLKLRAWAAKTLLSLKRKFFFKKKNND